MPVFEVYRRARLSPRTTIAAGTSTSSSMKKLTLVPSADATFMSVAIVGVMPLFSILWTEAVETPARRASSASDQPRSARAAATFAPSAETVRSMSGSESGAILRAGSGCPSRM